MLDEEETPASLGKAPVKDLEKSPMIKVEKLELETVLPHMKIAAKMRTRLDTKTIKRKTVHIPNSSDNEWPETVEPLSAISSTRTSPPLTNFTSLDQEYFHLFLGVGKLIFPSLFVQLLSQYGYASHFIRYPFLILLGCPYYCQQYWDLTVRLGQLLIYSIGLLQQYPTDLVQLDQHHILGI
ncbi:hypothetical protein B0H10DRAFT_2217260 [Mycena sp. CBHHK59/15]|nr:hypothetical protein B0H10DRAFT_2217260 [Mycena sp. CBHHK59/15]